MNKQAVKKWGTLLLLSAGAGIIFQLPYIRETFYVPIQKAMTNLGISGYCFLCLQYLRNFRLY